MKGINCLFILFVFLFSAPVIGQGERYILKNEISYYSAEVQQTDPYIKERCKLDVYYPKDTTNVATVVWFHGGGLEFGQKDIPNGLKEKGIAVVSVNYRLHPKVQHPEYIKDAAAAVAWTFQNIKKFNGNPDKIFLSGHSAGGYLALMIGMDQSYLANHEIDANKLAGLIPFSGHTITHFTIRKEKGIEGTQPIIDKFAPLFHVRKDTPPILLITGNRELELLGRYEENAYFYRMMKVVGNENIDLMELDGYGHNMVYPAVPLLLEFVKRLSKE